MKNEPYMLDEDPVNSSSGTPDMNLHGETIGGDSSSRSRGHIGW